MAISPLPMDRAPRVSDRAVRRVLLAASLALAALFVFVVGATGLFMPALGLVAIGAVCYCAWRWPVPTAIALMALLPASRFISFALFAATDSSMVVRVSQLWKDFVLVVLLLRVAHEAFLRRQWPRIHLLDLLVVFYTALVALYMLYPGVDGGGVNLMGKLMAVRQDAFYVLAYFVGRGLTLRRREVRLICVTLAAFSLLVGVVAALQWAAPGKTNSIMNDLGFSRFMAVVGSPHEVEAVRNRGLATTDLPRASSLLLSDTGLAFFQLLAIPFAAALFFRPPRRSHQLAGGFFLLAMLGTLAMTITRTALIAAGAGLAVLTFWARSYPKAIWLCLGCVVAVLAFLAFSNFHLSGARELFSGEESSAAVHIRYIDESFRLIEEQPLGRGLGQGSHVSRLAGAFGSDIQTWSTESWYLQLAVEMGVPGLVLFTLPLLLAVALVLNANLRVREPWLQVLTLGTAGAGVGFLVVGAFQPVWAATQMAFLFWMLAGIAVRARGIEREWAEAEEGRVEAAK